MNDNYVNLHVHTDASIGDSIIKIPDLVKQVEEYGQDYVAVTDHGSVANWYALQQECKKSNVKPLYGDEFYCKTVMNKPENTTRYHLVCIAMNDEGATNIRKMQRLSVTEHHHYKPLVPHQILFDNPEGIFVSTACALSYICQNFEQGHDDIAYGFFNKLLDVFGKDNVAIELQYHPSWSNKGVYIQNILNQKLIKLYEDTDCKWIINTFDSHVLLDKDRILRKKLQSINWKKDESQISDTLESNVLGNTELSYKFGHASGIEDDDLIQLCIDNTHKIAEHCYFDMTEYERVVPKFDKHEDFERIFCKTIY